MSMDSLFFSLLFFKVAAQKITFFTSTPSNPEFHHHTKDVKSPSVFLFELHFVNSLTGISLLCIKLFILTTRIHATFFRKPAKSSKIIVKKQAICRVFSDSSAGSLCIRQISLLSSSNVNELRKR